MSTRAWPGLGFDPAPGDPAATGGLVRQLDDTARRLRETHDVLSSVQQQRGTWTGEASKAFAAKLDGLPGYLASAHASMQRAGGVLGRWQAALGGLQTRAHGLETRALVAREELAGAEYAARAARAHPDFGLVAQQFSADELSVAQRRVNDAQAGLDRAVLAVAGLLSSLEVLLREGEALRAEHEGEARRTADGVRAADDGLTPPEPAWFEKMSTWVVDNLDLIGDVAGMVSSIAATLALIPMLTPFAAPIALVAGGVALLAHGADVLVHEEKRTDVDAWVDVGADLAGLLPGLRILGAAHDGAMTSIRAGDGIRSSLSAAWEAGSTAVPTTLAAMGEAGGIAKRVADGVTPALNSALGTTSSAAEVAKTVEGMVGLGTQVPTVVEWATGEEDSAVGRQAPVVDIGVGFTDFRLDQLARAAGSAAGAAAS